MVHYNSESSLAVELKSKKYLDPPLMELSPRCVCPYEIFQSVGKVAYELRFFSELASVHLEFHVSFLKKCIGDP